MCSQYSDYATGWKIRDSYLVTDKQLFSSKFTTAVETIKNLFNVEGGYFAGVKRLEHEFDYSSPPSANVKIEQDTALRPFKTSWLEKRLFYFELDTSFTSLAIASFSSTVR